MKIAVVGASGRTGRLVVERALARGYGVTAVARQPQQSSWRDQRLTTMAVDVLDRGRVVGALSGVDAVISTLGIGTSREPTVTYSEGTGNLLYAMGLRGIKRIVVVSASPVGPRQDQAAFDRYVVMPILERFFGATYQDMRRMENLLTESGTDWTSLRPPRLLEKPPVGAYRISSGRPLPKARTLTYADLATSLIDALDRDDLRRRAAYVAN
ncbi:NAD(P)-dependent oxidoreductase [Micromonospora fulviviridis]|uniref:NAD(P)H-binding protein n=1 Tax=Micromonospora fulviviridis TaxID=47860 RepID=A0ABV2VPP3_9ACTN